MDIKENCVFKRLYEYSINLEISPGLNAVKQFEFMNKENNIPGGINIQVTPKNKVTWHGLFRSGYMSNKVISGVFCMPNPYELCVVASGLGYIVNVNTPTNWNEVVRFPIIDTKISFETNAIIFCDFTEISAYSSNGHLWSTKRISWDGIEIIEINNKKILGLAWDATIQNNVEFEVDILNGKHKGGAKFI